MKFSYLIFPALFLISNQAFAAQTHKCTISTPGSRFEQININIDDSGNVSGSFSKGSQRIAVDNKDVLLDLSPIKNGSRKAELTYYEGRDIYSVDFAVSDNSNGDFVGEAYEFIDCLGERRFPVQIKCN